MKKGCLFLLTLGFLVVLLGAGLLYYDLSIAPRQNAIAFCDLWKNQLQSISKPEDIPSAWRDTVYCRRFSDGWIVAAMYHGSCTENGGKAFNASVYRDSDGHTVVYHDYSPCAGGIEDMGRVWEFLAPAATFKEYKAKFKSGPPKSG